MRGEGVREEGARGRERGREGGGRVGGRDREKYNMVLAVMRTAQTIVQTYCL